MGKWTVDQVVTGLHELADYVATHADLPYNLEDYSAAIDFETFMYGESDEKSLPQVARKMGKCEKDAIGGLYVVRKKFGDGAVEISFNQSREDVCTKVQIGTKVQKKYSVPEVIGEEIVPDYEYQCPESLLRDTN